MSAINERVSAERLAEIIARAEVCDDSVLTDYRDIESIARELQQYRAAAEPVAWRWNYGGSTNWRLTETKPNFVDKYVQHFVEPLYAAPQVTSVLEQVPESLKDRLLTICDLVEDNDEYCQDIWNACRAAMLNGGKS